MERIARLPPLQPKPNPNPSPRSVTEPEQPNVTATRKTARPEKPETKPTTASNPATGKHKEEIRQECQNHCRQTHNTQSGGPHPKLHNHKM